MDSIRILRTFPAFTAVVLSIARVKVLVKPELLSNAEFPLSTDPFSPSVTGPFSLGTYIITEVVDVLPIVNADPLESRS
jgi:hypothetical protein